jgi:DNA-binding SARP family transcriptional activator
VVRIRLFGGVSAATDGGEPLGVGSAKSQAVLAALAVSPGSAVPVSRLVDLVWGRGCTGDG